MSIEIPGSEELVARASKLVPVLRERGSACEKLRKIPVETVADYRAAGFLQIAVPRKFGGYGLGLDEIVKVGMEIGRGCGSSAWMAGQWPGHQFMFGYFPEETQAEIWANGPDVMSSTASAVARVSIEPENGGWRVTDSQMRFSSGCDHADWIFFITQHGMGLIPRSEFTVLDDWYVAGLRGTGSKSVVIKDYWIPPHHFVAITDLRNGTSPGALLEGAHPQLAAPFNLSVNQLLLSAAIGMSRGILEIFEERVANRMDLHSFKPASESVGAQLRFAESAAEVDCAIMLALNNCQKLTEMGASKRLATDLERAEVRRNVCYALKLALTASERLLTSGDASGMYDDQALGRLGRDIHMAGLQANLTWDETAISYSRTRWGVDQPRSNLQ